MTMAIEIEYDHSIIIQFANTTGSDIVQGDVVVMGTMLGVAVTLIPATTGIGPVKLGGIYKFAKSAGVITLGDELFWDNTNFVATKSSGLGLFLGTAIETVISGATTIRAQMGVARKSAGDQAISASTAAAGSTNADAAALPAGTSTTYPTTAADGTKGVILNAADQVTGRRLFIGNGVSNAVLKVYAPSGGVINGAAANAAFSSVSGKGVIIECLSGAGNTWLAW